MNPLHSPSSYRTLSFGGDLEFEAFSISALATYVVAPRFGLAFDLGHCTTESLAVRDVFLSHTHLDHIAGVPLHASLRQMRELPGSRFYCPAESRDALIGLLSAHDALEGNSGGRELARYAQVVGVAPGEEIQIGTRLTVKAFRAHHRIASLGYTVYEHRKRLRPEFEGKPGPEIGAAARSGVEVNERFTVPAVTYLGDCTEQTLWKNPDILQSRVVFLEATHIGDSPTPEFSVTYGHTHLDQLVRFLQENNGPAHVVIKHFSMRYDRGQLAGAYERLPEGIRSRVTFLVPE